MFDHDNTLDARLMYALRGGPRLRQGGHTGAGNEDEAGGEGEGKTGEVRAAGQELKLVTMIFLQQCDVLEVARQPGWGCAVSPPRPSPDAGNV